MDKVKYCTPFNPMEHTTLELRLVSIYTVPATGEEKEGIVWRFGLHPEQIADLKVSYSL